MQYSVELKAVSLNLLCNKSLAASMISIAFLQSTCALFFTNTYFLFCFAAFIWVFLQYLLLSILAHDYASMCISPMKSSFPFWRNVKGNFSWTQYTWWILTFPSVQAAGRWGNIMCCFYQKCHSTCLHLSNVFPRWFLSLCSFSYHVSLCHLRNCFCTSCCLLTLFNFIYNQHSLISCKCSVKMVLDQSCPIHAALVQHICLSTASFGFHFHVGNLGSIALQNCIFLCHWSLSNFQCFHIWFTGPPFKRTWIGHPPIWIWLYWAELVITCAKTRNDGALTYCFKRRHFYCFSFDI